MDNDNNSKIIDFDQNRKKSKIAYDEKKLHRLLTVFDSMHEQMVGTMVFDDALEYMNMKILIENYADSFFNRLLKNDKTVLPFVLLMKIFDRLNEVEINFDTLMVDDMFGPMNVENLPSELIDNFPRYYRRNSNGSIPEEILDYFIEEMDLDKYNQDILYLIVLMMSGVLFDHEESEKFAVGMEKIFDAVSKYEASEISNSFHVVLSTLISQYIKNFIQQDYPLNEIQDKIEGIIHLYAAYGPFISFLTANDEVDLAFSYLFIHLPTITLLDRKFINELGLNISINSFLYVALCLDRLDFFKIIFPYFLHLDYTRDDITVLLLLYKKCASPSDYEEFMKSLIESDSLDNKAKKELKRFYLKHETSSN